MGEVVGSSVTGQEVELLILIRKIILFTIAKINLNGKGRCVSVRVTSPMSDFRFTNVYALDSPMRTYLQDLVTWLSLMTTTQHIVGGDLNTVMSKAEDRSRKSPQQTGTRTSTKLYKTSTFPLPP